MSYYTKIIDTDISIPVSLFKPICQNLLASDFLNPDTIARISTTHGPHYSWCEIPQLLGTLEDNDLPALFELFRFKVISHPRGNTIRALTFDDKLGDEETLFRYIAAALPGTHFIDWQDEESNYYRFLIHNHTFQVLDGTLTFPPLPFR